MNKTKKSNWLLTSLIVAIITFFTSLALSGNWKASLILASVGGLITLSFNPIRRYIKGFWAVLSLLVSTNFYSLKYSLILFSNDSLSEVDAQLGTNSNILTICLFLLCILLLILDFMERNGKIKFRNTKMIQKGGKNSTNIQAKGNITINNDDKR